MKYHLRKRIYKLFWIFSSTFGMAFIMYYVFNMALDDYRSRSVTETPLSFSQVPQKLQSFVKNSLGLDSVKEIEKITTKNSVAYEFGGEERGVEYDVKVTEDGQLMESGREIGTGELPADVLKSLHETYPTLIVESVERKHVIYYEIKGMVKGVKQIIKIHPNGLIHGPNLSNNYEVNEILGE